MRSYCLKSQWAQTHGWVVAVCAIMLIATSMEAAHLCDARGLALDQQVRTNVSITAGHGFCLMCMGAHWAALVSPTLRAHIGLALSPVPMSPVLARLQTFQSFALHVRPPPTS